MAGDSGIDRGLVGLRAGQFVGEERRDRGEIAQGLRVANLNVSDADAGVVPLDCDVCLMRNGARTRLIADGTNHCTHVVTRSHTHSAACQELAMTGTNRGDRATRTGRADVPDLDVLDAVER